MLTFSSGFYFCSSLLASFLFLVIGLWTLKRIGLFSKKKDICRAFMMSAVILFLGCAFSGLGVDWKNSFPVKERMEIIFAIDASLSSLARDVSDEEDGASGRSKNKISRLELEKRQVASAIGDLSGDGVGIMAFADVAIPLQVVLSREDYKNSVLRNLRSIDESFCRYGIKQGTDYGALIMTALEMFGAKSDIKKLFIVLTDGETQGDKEKLDQSLGKALEKLAERDDIVVLFVGVGDALEPSKIPMARFGENAGEDFYRGPDGALALTMPNPEMLNKLAVATKGKHIHPSSSGDLKKFLSEFIMKERRTIGVATKTETINLASFFIAGALGFLLIIPILKSV